ncbi:hypothetical protein Pla108_03690 [Botrimarina colliarenosi]|uniref:Uncharacterized protein n=1 Tax=Botrimarina colliarenosi TaxID=2528001 RepID=A0A5C6AJ52_9BACT|nr:hypothetical protein [Botrimarina colliarenosi]TWT99430.1 hypothetical protein Pla108_03690 [Botrimarina colliarenosi]
MSEKKPEPLQRAQAQRKCPVCGHSSYSVDGIHPQCHRAKADKKRLEVRAAEARANPPEPVEATEKKGAFNSAARFRSPGA